MADTGECHFCGVSEYGEQKDQLIELEDARLAHRNCFLFNNGDFHALPQDVQATFPQTLLTFHGIRRHLNG